MWHPMPPASCGRGNAISTTYNQFNAIGCKCGILHAISFRRLYVILTHTPPQAVWCQTDVISRYITEDMQKELGITDDWVLTHRVDLHNALRMTATREVNGKKASIRLSSRVASMVSTNHRFGFETGHATNKSQDAEAGVVTLEDGTVYTGDLIIGADGIHVRQDSMLRCRFLTEIPVTIGPKCRRRRPAQGKHRTELLPLPRSLVKDAGESPHGIVTGKDWIRRRARICLPGPTTCDLSLSWRRAAEYCRHPPLG